MKATVAVIASIALASCSSHGGNATEENAGAAASSATQPTPASDPTADDARVAVSAAMNLFPVTVIRSGPVGKPSSCSAGLMNGQKVLSCQVCATFLVIPDPVPSPSAVRAIKVNMFVPFKRAISRDQADVSPVDDSTGVWVNNFPAPNPQAQQAPSYRTVLDVGLEPQDFNVIGFTANGAGGFLYDMHDTAYVKIAASYRASFIRDKFMAANVNVGALLRGKIGACSDGTSPEVGPDPTVEHAREMPNMNPTGAMAARAPVELPLAIKAEKTLRCDDNSLLYVTFFEGDKRAVVKTERTGNSTVLKAPVAGGPLTAEGGWKLAGNTNTVSFTAPGKGITTCHT